MTTSTVTVNRGLGLGNAMFAGFFGACASLFAKLAFAGVQTRQFCLGVGYYLQDEMDMTVMMDREFCDKFVGYVRLGCFLTMLLFNALMWTSFVKALRFCSSSAEATVANTATNFIFTAVFSQVVYGETQTLVWWCGVSFILTGLLVISSGGAKIGPTIKEETDDKKSKEKKEK